MVYSGVEVDTRGAIASFDQFRPAIKQELERVYPKVGRQVVRRAQSRAPVLTGRLRAGIKQTAARTSANIKVGGTKALPYAAPIHWGWDGKTGPWFVYRIGYPQATRARRGPVADWIYDEFTKAMNRAVKRLNKHLGKGIGLMGPALRTGE